MELEFAKNGDTSHSIGPEISRASNIQIECVYTIHLQLYMPRSNNNARCGRLGRKNSSYIRCHSRENVYARARTRTMSG